MPEARTTRKPSPGAPTDVAALLTRPTGRRVVSQYRKHQIVFAQGHAADSVFYIQAGEVKLTVVSRRGKAAIIAILRAGDFFGERCLTGQSLRMATASALTEASIVRIDRAWMMRLLATDAAAGHRASRPERWPGSPPGDDRHDAGAGQRVHEQVPQARAHRVQRWPAGHDSLMNVILHD